MIHIYAGSADFPDTLCPAGRAWKTPVHAVHPIDLDKADCPDCLNRHEQLQAAARWRRQQMSR